MAQYQEYQFEEVSGVDVDTKDNLQDEVVVGTDGVNYFSGQFCPNKYWEGRGRRGPLGQWDGGGYGILRVAEGLILNSDCSILQVLLMK